MLNSRKKKINDNYGHHVTLLTLLLSLGAATKPISENIPGSASLPFPKHKRAGTGPALFIVIILRLTISSPFSW